MSVAEDSVLQFLDLSFHVNERNKIYVDVYAKPTYNFTYVLPSTCYPKMNINNIPKSIAVRLARICNSDEKFDTRSDEYKYYLIARDYNISLDKKQFQAVRSMSRSEDRQVKRKVNKEIFNLAYSLILKNLQRL